MTTRVKQYFFLSIIIFSISNGQIKYSPGAFTRMGFDARGLSMGNAMSTVTIDNSSSYYNPAVIAFLEKPTFSASYTFLSLDRNLNTLSYSQRLKIKQADSNRYVVAGFSAGLLNAGVSNIEERDRDGFLTDNLSTFENQFFFSAAIRFTDKISIGANFKFYYSKIYEEVTSSGFGVDIGAIYIINDKLSISATIKEINTEYIWDTSPIYGQSGNVTKDRFPLLKCIGTSYTLNDQVIFAAEFENSNQGTNIFRFGSEIMLLDFLFFRIGLDRLDFSNKNGIKPSFGFGLNKNLNLFTPNINYLFSYEPFTHSPIQMITLNIQL